MIFGCKNKKYYWNMQLYLLKATAILHFSQLLFSHPVFIFGSCHTRDTFEDLRQSLWTGKTHLISNILDGKIFVTLYQSFHFIHLEPIDPDIEVDPFHTIQIPRQLTRYDTYFIGNTHDADVVTQIGLLFISLPCSDQTDQVILIAFIFGRDYIFHRFFIFRLNRVHTLILFHQSNLTVNSLRFNNTDHTE